ncbi:hypothetical protein Nepgr_033565 [Nepenthes gracilis]|uniref:Uncharacterized protein n=1 Tax=Nepenthes gracilis TaxID=150966 RepID=A0AAD3TM57_NEPGR|nr:hypothetical protein Nepgr_033565 [Nepenthes gracilis]
MARDKFSIIWHSTNKQIQQRQPSIIDSSCSSTSADGGAPSAQSKPIMGRFTLGQQLQIEQSKPAEAHEIDLATPQIPFSTSSRESGNEPPATSPRATIHEAPTPCQSTINN